MADDRGDSTYRAVYTVTIGDVVYVLDVFKKQSKKGLETPKKDLARIKQRLKAARKNYEETHERK